MELRNFGKDIVGKIPNFDWLRPLKVFFKEMYKFNITSSLY